MSIISYLMYILHSVLTMMNQLILMILLSSVMAGILLYRKYVGVVLRPNDVFL